jgi:hypothetical protein
MLPHLQAAQQRLHARHQLAHRQRLGHVIVRARVQTGETVREVALGGDHDDAHVRERPHLAAYLDPVPVRQDEIEQHQVRGPTLESSHRLGSGPRLDHLKAPLLERRIDHLAGCGIVVNNQYRGGHERPPAFRS